MGLKRQLLYRRKGYIHLSRKKRDAIEPLFLRAKKQTMEYLLGCVKRGELPQEVDAYTDQDIIDITNKILKEAKLS